MKVTLPDGTELELDDGATGADAAAAIGPGLARAALAVRVNGEVARPRAAAARRRQARDRHRQGRRRPPAHPPRRRARPRDRGHGAPPGREDLDRPPDRAGLLLRLRVPRGHARLRGGLRGDRGADARARQGRRALRARGRPGRAGARALRRRGPGLQGRADRRPREGRGRGDGVPLYERPVHRSLPRAPRPHDQDHQGVQAPVGRRRVLARRLRQPDAHAHLRDGVPLQGGARGAPRAARAGARPRPPQARA